MSFSKILSLIACGLPAILFLQCAGQYAPTGGPVDITPPKIIRTLPDSSATRVHTDRLEFEFSKYVDRRSFEEAVFISPYLGELEFDWSGKEVVVKFSGTLRENTTYVVNIGTDVVDVRAGNRMAAGYTLAFTTGDSIDKGFITGRVFDPKPEGVMIFAYALTGRNADTLNPSSTKPDYLMQTGKDGRYVLANLAFGPYRVFAIRDEYKNLLYDKQVDQFGVAPRDILLNSASPRIAEVNFRLSREDSTRPFVAGARALFHDVIQVRFSEALDSAAFTHATFTVTDSLTKALVPLRYQFLPRTTPAIVTLVTSTSLDSAAYYRVTARGLADLAGNSLDTLHASELFAGTGRKDTAKLAAKFVSLTDSTRNVPLDQLFEITFSRPVAEGPVTHALSLLDSTRKSVPAAIQWLNPTDVMLRPRTELFSSAWYQVVLRLDSVRDLRGEGGRDSTVHMRFQTMSLRTTGYVEGEVEDVHHGPGSGPIFVTGTSIDLTPVKQRRVRLEKPGPFALDRLPEGKYVLDAFNDADSSGNYSYGLPYPYKASERFTVYPDTIKVRARWGVEGVLIRFK